MALHHKHPRPSPKGSAQPPAGFSSVALSIAPALPSPALSPHSTDNLGVEILDFGVARNFDRFSRAREGCGHAVDRLPLPRRDHRRDAVLRRQRQIARIASTATLALNSPVYLFRVNFLAVHLSHPG